MPCLWGALGNCSTAWRVSGLADLQDNGDYGAFVVVEVVVSTLQKSALGNFGIINHNKLNGDET